MKYMATVADGFFDLAIVDPPYGIGMDGQKESKSDSGRIYRPAYKQKKWDNKPPDQNYFNELFRISQNQIIWGGNYFNLPLSRGWVFWYKKQNNLNMGDGELAWTSFDRVIRQISIHRGVLWREGPIHPTQKPVALYKWLLQNYAKPGWKILDTHVGSGSSRIAAYDLGFDFVGCEMDPDYWQSQEDRFQNYIANGELFGKQEITELVYEQESLI